MCLNVIYDLHALLYPFVQENTSKEQELPKVHKKVAISEYFADSENLTGSYAISEAGANSKAGFQEIRHQRKCRY
jgi:hypothetical protein